MTPLQIEILLYYYTRVGDFRDGDFSAPAVDGAISDFLGDGLLQPVVCEIRKGVSKLQITDGGRLYVEALMKVPTPVRRWVMP